MKKRILALLACAAMALGMTACGSPSNEPVAKDVDLSKMLTDIKGNYGAEDTWPSMQPLDATLLKDLYGIDEADLESYVGEMPMMNVQVDEFLIAKVKDGKMETVKAGMEKRAKDLDTQWQQYLPDKHEIVKNYKIVENGNYVMFAVSEFAGKAEESFNTLTK